jgi:hypothetical protein
MMAREPQPLLGWDIYRAAAVLAGLVPDGLVDVQAETVSAGGRTTEIVRVRITAAGRRAIED